MSKYYSEHKAMQTVSRPSDLLKRIFGNVTKGARALSVTPQDAYNWNRGNRIPKAIYDALVPYNPSVVRGEARRVVRVKQPYRLATVYGKSAVKMTGRRGSPVATTSSITAQVERLERENASLRTQLAKVRAIVSGR